LVQQTKNDCYTMNKVSSSMRSDFFYNEKG
jgi:hypothetical protein